MNKDLTVGNPHKVLWLFCLPLFLSMIFQQMYNIADSLVAGSFISDSALAAVGTGYEITLVFIAFGFGCNIGCSVIISRLFGEKRFKDLKTSVYTTFIASAVLCAVLIGIGFLVIEPVLKQITPPEAYEDALLYMRIYMIGFPFVLFYYVATGIFSALGDSKTPLIFLICSSLTNIGMDILFVAVFKMGVGGVAWATFICQGVSCILAVIFVLLRFRKIPHGDEKPKLFSWRLLGEICIVAIPSVLQQTFISVGNLLIQGIIAGHGTQVVAGYSAAIKLNNLVIASIVTVANGVSNYTAQNLGAGKDERVSQGFKASIIMVLIICLPLVALYFFGGRFLVDFFSKENDATTLDTGEMILKILSPFYFIVAIKLVCDGILRGGKCMGRFMICTLIDLIIRVALAFILDKPEDPIGIWIAFPIGWIISTIISYLCYHFNKTIHKKKEKAKLA